MEGDPSKTIYCHPSQDIGSPTTTSDLHVDVEALTACIGSVQVKDTPKSRRPHCRGSRRIYRGKALFHAEDEETMQVFRTEKSGNIVRNANWTEDELRHLTSFLMLHTDGKREEAQQSGPSFTMFLLNYHLPLLDQCMYLNTVMFNILL